MQIPIEKPVTNHETIHNKLINFLNEQKLIYETLIHSYDPQNITDGLIRRKYNIEDIELDKI